MVEYNRMIAMLVFHVGGWIIVFIHNCEHKCFLSFLIYSEREYTLNYTTMRGRIMCVLQIVIDEWNVRMYLIRTLS